MGTHLKLLRLLCLRRPTPWRCAGKTGYRRCAWAGFCYD